MPKTSRPFDKHVDRGQHLGLQHRRAVRHDGDRGHEAKPRRLAGDKGYRGQLLVPVAARPAREFAGVAVGIFGLDVAGNHDMVADRGVVVTHRLALDRDAREIVGRRERSADRRAEAKLHLCPSAEKWFLQGTVAGPKRRDHLGRATLNPG